MSCYRPNIGYFNTATEPRTRLKFISGNKKKAKLDYEWFNQENEKFRELGLHLEYIQLRCGQCEACQEKDSKEWAIRCVLESELHDHNYFITLTYNEDELPVNEYIINEDTGEIFEDDGTWYFNGGTLKPEDMDQFLAKLRRHYEYRGHQGIKYYYCGEYGEQSMRAHYHMIAFNMPIDPKDLKVYRINTDGSTYYTCKWLTNMWGKGHVVIGEVNWDTCAYTARYVMKKLKKWPKEEYYKRGKIPEFVRMSRRPGIAREAYKESFFKNDEIIIKGHREKIQAAKPPRYYEKIYDIDHHDNMVKIKEKRQEVAEAAQKREMQDTSLSIREHLRMKQRQKKDVWKSLKRNKI